MMMLCFDVWDEESPINENLPYIAVLCCYCFFMLFYGQTYGKLELLLWTENRNWGSLVRDETMKMMKER